MAARGKSQGKEIAANGEKHPAKLTYSRAELIEEDDTRHAEQSRVSSENGNVL